MIAIRCLVSACFFAMASQAIAASKIWTLTTVVGDHQDITSTVVQHPSGRTVVAARYSNGHKTDGDNFMADVLLFSGDEQIGNVPLGEAVNATFGGSTNVRFKHAILELGSTQITKALVHHYMVDTKGELVAISFKCKESDDGANCFPFPKIDKTRKTKPGPAREMTRGANFDPCSGWVSENGRRGAFIERNCDRSTGKRTETTHIDWNSMGMNEP